jgi:hypothetical protein
MLPKQPLYYYYCIAACNKNLFFVRKKIRQKLWHSLQIWCENDLPYLDFFWGLNRQESISSWNK